MKINGNWDNSNLVILGVDDLDPYLSRKCVTYSEDEYGMTSLATGDPTGLGHLKLLAVP